MAQDKSLTPRIPETRLLKSTEVAALLNVTARTVCLWGECGDLPSLRVRKAMALQAIHSQYLAAKEGVFSCLAGGCGDYQYPSKPTFA